MLQYLLLVCAAIMNYHAAHAQCPPINPRPDMDPWTMRLPSAGFGGISVQQINGYNDVYLTSPGGTVQVSARLDWGGTIVFFGEAGNYASNTIDCHDTGRELQIALYDNTQLFQPCAQNNTCAGINPASCGTTNNWLGWDPVQGGDRCGHGSKIISYGQVGDALQLVVQPVQWNPDWSYSTCDQDCNGPVPVDVIYTFELRFVDENIVEVMTQIVSQETYSHALSGQEFPCLYVALGEWGLDLPVLLNSSGNQIVFNPNIVDTLEFNSNAWASWQQTDTTLYGVGMAADQGTQQFYGVNGPPGGGYFHYVRPINNFAITAGSTIRGISYLTLGNFDTVTGLYDKVLATRPPFGFVDQPATQTPVAYTPGQQILFEGWSLSSWNTFITIMVDNNPVMYINSNISRPDVCAIYPSYAGCPNKVGFLAYLDTTNLDASCSHLVSIYASDSVHNNDFLLADRVITPQ